MNLISPSRPNTEAAVMQPTREDIPKYDRQFSVLHGQVKRIKRVSILSLLLIVLATIVHIVQFFVPPAKINQQYAKIVEGNRAAYMILNSFSLALENVTALGSVQQRTTYHCIEMLRQAVRCQADPTLDVTNYDKLFEWSEKNRADDSTGLEVVYGYST
ncbi:hypothetical protein SLS63_008586 [Diaporthe eres]|uniref:Uncharacterized protein n=1 Tax=Diaporthe eres TaxID=83184 RepID=A0ABR1P1Z6_DIAER